MSHKRTRSSKTTPKNLILINEEVKERFDSIFKHQPMMLEKGFDLKIREFYASLTTQDATKVIVRNKKVPLTSKSINDLFNLPDVVEDQYYPMMNNINWDFLQQVFDVVTNPGSQWIIRKYGTHSHRIEYLKPIAKVWFYFVHFNFMPISHSSTISMERMLLLYAILTENSINVGKLIFKEIQDCAKKKAGSVYFPSLITSLCLKACVKTQANLKGQYVQGCITNYDLEILVERVHELNQGDQEEPTKPIQRSLQMEL
ncbi:hypothetical protein Gotur_030928, partial [Gossypium turneri]